MVNTLTDKSLPNLIPCAFDRYDKTRSLVSVTTGKTSFFKQGTTPFLAPPHVFLVRLLSRGSTCPGMHLWILVDLC